MLINKTTIESQLSQSFKTFVNTDFVSEKDDEFVFEVRIKKRKEEIIQKWCNDNLSKGHYKYNEEQNQIIFKFPLEFKLLNTLCTLIENLYSQKYEIQIKALKNNDFQIEWYVAIPF